MELLAKLKVDNIYKAKEFVDKKTGETTPGKWKIQTFEKVESEDGDQMKLIDISIPEERVKDIKDKVGQVVTISVATFVNSGKVGYYGV